jgi:hypothetical protein
MGSYPEHGEGQSTHPFPQLLQYPIQTNDSPQRNYHLISRSRTIKDERHYHHGMVDPSWSGSRYDVDTFNKDESKKRRASDFSERKLSHSPVTDTYYHQSRRKKRDTKPPNANDVRPFVEIEKDNDGNPIFPAEVDSWTVLSIGSVVWDRAAFHNQRYIYPVGYCVKK